MSSISFLFLFVSLNLHNSYHFCSTTTLFFDSVCASQLRSINKSWNPKHTAGLVHFLQSDWFRVKMPWWGENTRVSFRSKNALRSEAGMNQTAVSMTEWCLICTFIRETRAKNKTRPNTVLFRINSGEMIRILNYLEAFQSFLRLCLDLLWPALPEDYIPHHSLRPNSFFTYR